MAEPGRAGLETRRTTLFAHIARLRASRPEDSVVVPVALGATAAAVATTVATGNPVFSSVGVPLSILGGGGAALAIKIVRAVRVAKARAQLHGVERQLAAQES